MNAATVLVPPHAVDAEQSILAGLLLDNGAWERLDGSVSVDDFYRHDHRLIFDSVSTLLDRGMPADVLTVHDALQAAGNSQVSGGLST